MYMDGDQWFFYQLHGAWKHRGPEHIRKLIFDWIVEYRDLNRRFAVTPARLNAVQTLVQNLLGPHEMNELDTRTDWIPLANGVLEIGTGKLLPHAPGNLITRILPYAYQPDAKCPRWLQFLDETVLLTDAKTPCKEWQELLQEWFGYCLIPSSQAQASMFWLGSGANGKGVAQKVLEQLVGRDQVASILMKKLDDPYHLAYLYGKHLATISEIDRNAMRTNGQMLKAIIGGDTISGRRPTENFFDFSPTVRVLATCNYMPKSDDTSEGYFRRIIPMEWRRNLEEHERDTMLDDKLRGELPGIFIWSLEGLRRWQARGCRFVIPDESKRLLNEYRSSEDNLRRFIEECCLLGDGQQVHSKPFYQRYCFWCDENGERNRTLPNVEVGRRLGQMGFEGGRPTIEKLTARGWKGIGLAPNPESIMMTDPDRSIFHLS